jgi:hypothetical protein
VAAARIGLRHQRLFLVFGHFYERFSQVRFFWKDFKKMDPKLGTIDRGAEV